MNRNTLYRWVRKARNEGASLPNSSHSHQKKMGARTNISLSKLLKTTDYIKENVKSNLTGHLSNVRRKV